MPILTICLPVRRPRLGRLHGRSLFRFAELFHLRVSEYGDLLVCQGSFDAVIIVSQVICIISPFFLAILVDRMGRMAWVQICAGEVMKGSFGEMRLVESYKVILGKSQ